MSRSPKNRFSGNRVATAWALFLLGITGLCGPTRAESGFSLDNTPDHTPRIVVPRHYSIALNPDSKSLTFDGSETIDIEVHEQTSTLVLNALALNVLNAGLTDVNLAADIALDPNQQTVTLHFPRTVGVGAHRLRLDFRGTINATAEGLFYTRYQSTNGQQKLMFCTQMEPTDARRVFPLWDEPAYRSTFELNVQVPESFTAISNMPVEREQLLGNGIKHVQFARTPSMAGYLLLLCAGEFEALGDEVDGVRIQVIATEGKKENGRYAIAVLKKLIPYYTDYFGLKYPLPKLDLIAVPGGLGGAMENWGAITFNEALVLFDPARSSQHTKEHVFSIIAHEVAHQWFGNLVTMAWWDNLWLNEGFASWMQNKATDHFNPAWQVWPRENLAKQAAMDLDARSTTHPIQQPIQDPAEAVSAFDAITYTKAAEIVRMIEAYLGEANFRTGIRHYLVDHQYSNTTTADLWDALGRASGQPVRSIASTWTEQPGFPLIRAQSACDTGQRTLKLAQERFTINDPRAEPLQWQVPVSFNMTDGNRPLQTFLLYGPAAQLDAGDCVKPIKLNVGNTGYYRVQYAPADYESLLDQFTQLPAEDRLSLLDDTWALVYGNRASAADYLSLLERLGGERELAVWEQVIATLEEIDRLQQGRSGRAAFQAYARMILRPVYERLGWNPISGETELDALLRASVLSVLGRLGDEAVIAEARRRFADFLAAEMSVSPNLRSTVFGIVGRNADQQAYDQLHELARKTDSIEQKEILYRAMSGAQDPKLAGQTLALSLTDELEPHLASSLVITVAHEGEHAEFAWEFLKNHLQPLLAKQSFFGRFRYVADLADSFKDIPHAQELLSFSEANLPAEAIPEIKKAAERIEFRDILAQRELPKIDARVCSHILDVDKQKSHLCGSESR